MGVGFNQRLLALSNLGDPVTIATILLEMAIGISQGICQPTGLICQNAFYSVAVCFQRPRLPRLFEFMTEAF